MADKNYKEASPIKYIFPQGAFSQKDYEYDPQKKGASILIGRNSGQEGIKEGSVLSYKNIEIETTPDEETKCKLRINLEDTSEDNDESLEIKFRKMTICDDNGKTAKIYVLASEPFDMESGFDPS